MRGRAVIAVARADRSSTGFFVTVPLVISVADDLLDLQRGGRREAPIYDRLLGRHVPGLGLLTTLLLVLLAGAWRGT